MEKLRLVFMGTPEFAVTSLQALIDAGCNIVGVVTAPDRPAGRGQQLNQSAVKKFAIEKGLTILQPEKLKDPNFLNELIKLKPNLQLVVAFRMLPEAVWNLPEHGTYNLHASLLPKYRGAAPINWAIINGEQESGVTTFKLKHDIDTGNILFAEKVKIAETTTAGELHDELMKIGSRLMVKTVNEIQSAMIENKQLTFIEQDNAGTCHAPKIFRETCRVNWQLSCQQIYNLVRGLSPYPGAYSELELANGKKLTLKIYVCLIEEKIHSHTNGSLITDSKTYLKIACVGGYILLTEVQLEGKRKMTIGDLLRGFEITELDRLI
jgi:methionyl-tRNA formyltransferase